MASEGSGTEVEGYWYPSANVRGSEPVDVLHAMRRFHSADVAMRQRLKTDMDMNETDLRALRHLIAAELSGDALGPKRLARALGITTAATAKLLARMVGSGHIRRERDPRDHRAQLLYPTADAHREVRKTLAAMHAGMVGVAEGLTPDDRNTVIRFLDSMSAVVEASSPE